MEKVCEFCGKKFVGRKERRFCSSYCADTSRRGKRVSPYWTTKTCEVCGKQFDVCKKELSRKLCSRACIPKYNSIHGKGVRKRMSESSHVRRGETLRNLWKNPEFRERKIKYMLTNNPVYMEGVVERANRTRMMNNSIKNNFKYGNGKISPHEQIVLNYVEKYGFVFNYSILTKLARDAFPEYRFSNSYKPDFTNLEYKICIEVDGNDHLKPNKIKLDAKKDFCLNYLGFTVYRFTHEQIDSGEFFKEFDKIWEDLSEKHIATQ